MTYVRTSALISRCGKYRYELWREWSVAQTRFERPGKAKLRKQRYVAFVGLNPSTADANKDDATIRRCVGYAKAWGYDGLVMLNLCAYRATDPKELQRVDDPVGPDNDRRIRDCVKRVSLVVACWGGNHFVRVRAITVLKMLRKRGDVHCILKTKWDAPAHPLRLPKGLTPVLYLR